MLYYCKNPRALKTRNSSQSEGPSFADCNTTGSVTCQYSLFIEFVASTTLTCSLRVTYRSNELGYDAMEFEPVIYMVLRQEHKVIDSFWCQLRIEFHHDQTTIS